MGPKLVKSNVHMVEDSGVIKGSPGFETRTGGRGEGGFLKLLKKFTTWAKSSVLGS